MKIQNHKRNDWAVLYEHCRCTDSYLSYLEAAQFGLKPDRSKHTHFSGVRAEAEADHPCVTLKC